MPRKTISIVTPCYNEEGNVWALRAAVVDIFQKLPEYDHEHIFIDNASTDATRALLRDLAAQDKKVRVILNSRNFGHIRSPYHAVLQARGDAVIGLAADFQDPPTLITDFIRQWELGHKVVLGVKTATEESPLMFAIRKVYYYLINRVAEIKLTKNNTGFGLYDRRVVNILRDINDPYPYFRGLVAEIGFEPAIIEYIQPRRQRGITKNNFYTLYDIAMLGITNHSKVPLRLATIFGFLCSALCTIVAFGYVVYKLMFWETFAFGNSLTVIGIFFFCSIQLFFIGILGEYVGSIHTQVLKRPLVIEEERINF